MKWESGRQGTGYLKKKLFQVLIFDGWLIKYPVGTKVPFHTDPVGEGKKHFRLNIKLYGEDVFYGTKIFQFGPVILFRSDLPHMVAEVTKERLILSLGMVL